VSYVAAPLKRFALPAAIAAGLLLLPGVAEAKVRSSLSGQILTVRGGKKPDRVAVVCDQGTVKVNGKDPGTGAIGCSKVSEVDAVVGAGNDRVNLSGVGSAAGFGQRELPGFGTGTGAAAELGPGSDLMIGADSAFNLAIGGEGDDRLLGGGFRDDLEGGAGNDRAQGGDGRDVILGNGGADNLNGGPGDDLISCNSGDDHLAGGLGADLLGGGLGKDILRGGDGDDELIGGPQKDRLNGGAGNNTLVQDFPKK
jgi:serralysin